MIFGNLHLNIITKYAKKIYAFYPPLNRTFMQKKYELVYVHQS